MLRAGVCAIVALLVVTVASAWWWERGGATHRKTAAIIDQLSTTVPDPEFVAFATKTLVDGGYAVDYVPGEQVTVEYFRQLPQRHYDVLVLRAHSGLTTVTNASTGEVTHTRSVSIFTSEPFDSDKYQDERGAGRLGRSRLLEDGKEVLGVFGIEPDFIRLSMHGRFDRTLVVLMRCNGLDAPNMAQAFIGRGASAVVGYDNFVSASFTDAVTSRLLASLFADHLPLATAVKRTADQFGPDPQFGGRLQLVTGQGEPSRN